MGVGLVLPRKVQIDVGDLVAPEAQKGLKGDVETVLHILCAAHRTHRVRHIRPAAIGMGGVLGIVEVGVLALGAAVVGRQRVYLGDAGHKGHQGGAHRPPGAHQVSVLQRVLHQLLGGHIDHVVFAPDDVAQLHLDAVGDDLGGIFPVKLMGFPPHQPLQFSVRILQLGGKQPLGQRIDGVAPVGDEVGVRHHHLPGLLLPQIGKLLEHLLRGFEVDGQGLVRIFKALGGQQDMPVDLILRVQEVDVPGGAHRLAHLLPQADDGAVEVPQLLLVLHDALAEHEHIVAQRLDLQIVVPRGDALELLPVLAVHHRLEQFPCLTG